MGPPLLFLLDGNTLNGKLAVTGNIHTEPALRVLNGKRLSAYGNIAAPAVERGNICIKGNGNGFSGYIGIEGKCQRVAGFSAVRPGAVRGNRGAAARVAYGLRCIRGAAAVITVVICAVTAV